ncbi:hypothetical protein F183_A53880 [Bryobacterales bacterium F-183]|nr:hypothetical protein F183_A53880 [Bryobacterales bacterium F-183]
MIYTTAVCESCSKPQPKDWQAGQLCIHCGNAVRRDVRCFWCVHWTPDAKYCRKCGADVIDPELFGVARMLKDAGTDRFTIPKLIGEFDEGRIATFRSLYLAQAAVVEAHVADLRRVESHLLQQHWSGELEEELVGQLPWPERQIPHHKRSETLAELAECTPFARTRNLAQLARLRIGDLAAYDAASNALYDPDPHVQEEAALTLTGWRVVQAYGSPRGSEALLEGLLQGSKFREQATVRLAYVFSRRHSLPRELLGSADPDVAFTAALASGDQDILAAAATDLHRDEPARFAACNRLAFDGPLGVALGTSLATLTPEHQVTVLDTIVRRKVPAHGLVRLLLQLAEATFDDKVRQRAILVLCREMSYETAMAVIPYAMEDTSITADLLRSGMPPEALAVFGERLVDASKFGESTWGLNAAAEPGRMPEHFVPAVYTGAKDNRTKRELIRFAELQARARDMDCPLLANFLAERCFVEPPGELQHEAWSTMYRVQRHKSHQAVCPFRLATPVVEEVFGSMDRFLGLLCPFLEQRDWRKDVIIFDPVGHFIRYVDEAVYPAICASRHADQYIAAIVSLLDDPDLYSIARHNAMYPLIGIGEHCPARRQEIIQLLEQIVARHRDLEGSIEYALRRLRGELG